MWGTKSRLSAVIARLCLVTLLCGCGLSTRTDGGTNGGGSGATGGSGGGTAGSNGGGTGGGTTPAWSSSALPVPASPRFLAVHGLSSGDVWVLSEDGTVFHTDGQTFTQ